MADTATIIQGPQINADMLGYTPQDSHDTVAHAHRHTV